MKTGWQGQATLAERGMVGGSARLSRQHLGVSLAKVCGKGVGKFKVVASVWLWVTSYYDVTDTSTKMQQPP